MRTAPLKSSAALQPQPLAFKVCSPTAPALSKKRLQLQPYNPPKKRVVLRMDSLASWTGKVAETFLSSSKMTCRAFCRSAPLRSIPICTSESKLQRWLQVLLTFRAHTPLWIVASIPRLWSHVAYCCFHDREIVCGKHLLVPGAKREVARHDLSELLFVP